MNEITAKPITYRESLDRAVTKAIATEQIDTSELHRVCKAVGENYHAVYAHIVTEVMANRGAVA